MNQPLINTIAILGTLFLACLLFAGGAYVAMRYGTLPNVTDELPSTTITTLDSRMSTDSLAAAPAALTYNLSEDQIRALTALGIDPDSLPKTITAEQSSCFINALGSARVQEISEGAVPGPLELLQVKSCL
jgi:hypothetical protein